MTQNFWLQSKWIRRFTGFCGVVLLFWALAWALLPVLIKGQAQQAASAYLSRTVTLGSVAFKPWTLELEIRDLQIAGKDSGGKGPDGSTPPALPALQIDRIYIDAELQSLLRLAPVVDEIRLENPVVNVVHLGEGRFDVDDVLTILMAPSDPPDQPLPKFALYNLSLSGGAVNLTDLAAKTTHQLKNLHLSLPFLSSLDSKRDIKTGLRLAFNLNGSSFDTETQGTPFARSHKLDTTFKLSQFDLQPYLAYFPKAMPVQLLAAMVDADIRIAFEQTDTSRLKLEGMLQASKVKFADARTNELLNFESLRVIVQEARPLEQFLRISSLELHAPQLQVRRDEAGRLNLLGLGGSENATKKEATKPIYKRANGTFNEEVKTKPWQLELTKLAVRSGVVVWQDDALKPVTKLTASDLTLDAEGLEWPFQKEVAFSGKTNLGSNKGKDGTALVWNGTAQLQSGKVEVILEPLPLALAKPYLAEFLDPPLNGKLSSQLVLSWAPQELLLQFKKLSFDNLVLGSTTPSKEVSLASVEKIEIADTSLDLSRKQISVGRLTVKQPRVKVSRDSDARWMFERWLKTATATPVEPSNPREPVKPWKFALTEASLQGGSVAFSDAAVPRNVSLEVSALDVQLKKWELDGSEPAKLEFSGKIRSAQSDPGLLDYKGSLSMQPMGAQGKVKLLKLPVHAFEPYLADFLNIELLRADASFLGDVNVKMDAKGVRLGVQGDASVDELRANSLSSDSGRTMSSSELLNWTTLSLRGIDVALKPGEPTRVAIAETSLNDFYARLTLYENGRLNLQDIFKSSDSPEPNPSPPAEIRMGPIALVNGRVRFSDRFIKPNYTANLSGLTGRLGAFSSEQQTPPLMADLSLRGQAEGSASLEVTGKLNPLAKPLALDIQGKVRDLELPPLSPYAVKFAGYGIERGKLNVDVAYRVDPAGQLTAKNKIVLNQLAFGDRVTSSSSNLPVKLAVSLLADRNGVIDIELPISGSLNDPEFRIGPIVFKVIVNLITKAITAPFSLLSNLFAGSAGDELSLVAFAPGSAELAAEARQGLDKVAKAMLDRPAIRLNITGTARLEEEREGYKQELLKRMLQAEKRRRASLAGQTGAVAPFTPQEAPDLLQEVYRRANISKPRNLVGLAKDLPIAEKQALLLTHISASQEQMEALALQRGQMVKSYLAQQVAEERLFLNASKTPAADSKWKPSAELTLGIN